MCGSFCAGSGSYTGDGSTSQGITGLGFSPMCVKIWRRQTGAAALFAKGLMFTLDNVVGGSASGLSVDLVGDSAAHHAIISLDADGFTVDDNGADEDPNAFNVTYNYLAMG